MTFVLCYHADHSDPQRHSLPFTVNQVFTVEANILFRQILENRIWVIDTRDNLREGFFPKERDNLLQGFFSLLDPVCP